MNRAFYKLSLSICALAVLCFLSGEIKGAEKDAVLTACENRYGKPFDAELNLYEVSRFYALQVKFDKKGGLEKSSVVPKYFFDIKHPEWKEPDDFENLTWDEYTKYRDFLVSLKPIGERAAPEPLFVIVTNMTAPHDLIYERAVLTWGERADAREKEDAPVQVRYIYIEYKKYKPRTIKDPIFSF